MISNNTNIYLPDDDLSFLVITNRNFSWQQTLEDISKVFHVAKTESDVSKALMENDYNVILYDDKTFSSPATNIVTELAKKSTITIISVISDELTEAYYRELVGAGAVDVISSSTINSEFMQRLTPMLHQSHKNRLLAERTRKLHAINSLSHKLHNSEHPTTLIVDAIDWICNYFGAHGVAITLDKGSSFQLYAGTSSINNHRRLYESTSEMKPYDPLLQVINSGISLIIGDITKHVDFVPIPVITEPKSAIIVPLNQGYQTIGSLAIFDKNERFTSDDLATFELLAVHITTAYINVRDHVWREADVQSMRQVLRAWPALNGVYTATEVASILHNFVTEIDSNQNIAVWMFQPTTDTNSGIVYSQSAEIQALMYQMRDAGELESLMSEFDNGLQPVTFHKRLAKTESLMRLYTVMKTNQITIVPIAGNRFEGAIFVANKLNQSVNLADLSIIENLARVAANVIERNILIDELQAQTGRLKEQTGRIEGILRSIREGIFFVADNGEVVYCNPQFTEITTITPSTVLKKNYKQLFKSLSERSAQRQNKMSQLELALEQLFDDAQDNPHPIVDINGIHNTQMFVEFMRADNLHDQGGWIGLIRNSEHTENLLSERSEMLQDMLEDINIPISLLSKTTMMLPEQYNLLRPQKFSNMLENVDKQVQHLQSMWGNYLQIHKGETVGLSIHTDSVNPIEFLSELFSTQRMFAYHRQIRFDTKDLNATIQIDERLIQQSLINIIDFIVNMSISGAVIFVTLVTEGQSNLVISLHEKVTHIPEETITDLLVPSQSHIVDDEIVRYRLGIYLAKQIINAHGGNLSIISGRGMGLTVKIQLPLESLEDTIETVHSEDKDDKDVSYVEPTKGLSMIVLESSSKYMAEMYPQLEVDGHEIVPEYRIENVLMDLSNMKVDVIFIEADRMQSGLSANCQQIRAQSEVPIIIIAIKELEVECLHCLGLGADDYFLVPLKKDKLLAQLKSIAKRHEMVSRTSEPIIVGDLNIDFSRRRVMLKDKLLDLTGKEYEILRVLAMNRNQVITHQQLLTKVWGPEHRDETQYLWVNISRLRRKLTPNKGDSRYIHNEQGVGYIFEFEEDYLKGKK